MESKDYLPCPPEVPECLDRKRGEKQLTKEPSWFYLLFLSRSLSSYGQTPNSKLTCSCAKGRPCCPKTFVAQDLGEIIGSPFCLPIALGIKRHEISISFFISEQLWMRVSWLEVFLETLRRMFFPPFSSLAVRPAVLSPLLGMCSFLSIPKYYEEPQQGVGFCNVEPEPSAGSSFCKRTHRLNYLFPGLTGCWHVKWFPVAIVTYLLYLYDPSLNRLTAQLRIYHNSHILVQFKSFYWAKCKENSQLTQKQKLIRRVK